MVSCYSQSKPRNGQSYLAILGAINIIYGAILAFRQTDFRLVLAYSSISHMGIVLFGIAAFNVIGMEGAIFQMVSHGLISALIVPDRRQSLRANRNDGDIRVGRSGQVGSIYKWDLIVRWT